MRQLRSGLGATVLVALSCAAAALPRAGAAQVVPAQPQKYLLVTDVADGRALLVNPAGLARTVEASIGGFISSIDSTSGVRVSQYGVLIASRGLGLGWQHDDFGSGLSGNTWAAGLALGNEEFSLGGDHRWYTGAAGSGGSWDAAGHYRYAALDLAAVWGNIGSPHVRDSILEETLTAGVAIDVLSRARISGEWHAATSGFPTRYVRAGVILVAGRGMLFSVVGSMSGDPALRSITFAVQLRAPRFRAALFDREPSQVGAANEFGLSVASVAPAPAGRGLRGP